MEKLRGRVNVRYDLIFLEPLPSRRFHYHLRLHHTHGPTTDRHCVSCTTTNNFGFPPPPQPYPASHARQSQARDGYRQTQRPLRKRSPTRASCLLTCQCSCRLTKTNCVLYHSVQAGHCRCCNRQFAVIWITPCFRPSWGAQCHEA